MAGFKFSRNTSNYSGGPRSYPIAATTAIEKGEIVRFTPGTGVVACSDYADFDAPVLGVSAVNHDGATDDGVQKETTILVYDHPDDIFELQSTNLLTATGGSTTTFVDSGLLPATDDVMNNGYLEVVSCAADSTMNGKMIKITDHTGSGGTLTFDTQPAAFALGDTARLHPGPNALTYCYWDMTSDGTDVDYAAGGGDGNVLQLWDCDPERKKAFFKLRLHQWSESVIV